MDDESLAVTAGEVDGGGGHQNWTASPPPRGFFGAGFAETWIVIAAALATAAALLLLAAIVRGFAYDGTPIRDRVFVVSIDGSRAWTAALALAAVGVTFVVSEPRSRRLGRWALACSTVVSAAVLAGVAYAIAYLGLAHPRPDVPAEMSTASIRSWSETYSWFVRLQGMLFAAASGVLVCAALFVAWRLRHSRAQHKQIDEWGDLRVGDTVRVTGPAILQRSDLFVIVELHVVDAVGPDGEDVMAVVRDPEGGLHTVPARGLEKH